MVKQLDAKNVYECDSSLEDVKTAIGQKESRRYVVYTHPRPGVEEMWMVHFAVCDGDSIISSEGSERLRQIASQYSEEKTRKNDVHHLMGIRLKNKQGNIGVNGRENAVECAKEVGRVLEEHTDETDEDAKPSFQDMAY